MLRFHTHLLIGLSLLVPAMPAGAELAPPDYRAYHGDRAFVEGLRALREGRPEVALDAVQRALGLEPDDPEALYLLGVCLIFAERYEEAEGALQRVTELRPDQAEAHHDLGLVLFQRNEGDRAFEAFGRLSELRPDSWYGPYRQAQTAAMLLGDWETCEEKLGTAVQRGFPYLASLPVDPEWAPVADQEAFLEMLTRLLERGATPTR